MERPSHIIFARHSHFSRTPLMALAISLQVVGAWLFTQGLASHVVTFMHPFTLAPMTPEVLPRTPPPPLPTIDPIKIPRVPIPTIPDTDPGPREGSGGITATTTQPHIPTPPMPTGIDRAAVSIAGTHTVPPYPPIARRLGVEGTVTLRLTVGTDGRVSAAEIVTSAGREDLDQAAKGWILAHWRYRAALKDGTPAPAQLLASVTYSLKNQP
jgi:protein TonB